MNKLIYAIAVAITFISLISMTHASSPPTITLLNSTSSNSIDLIIGSPSDNALVTATCTGSDTCRIYNAIGSVVASGTGSASIAYNALPFGYSTLYANDITNSLTSPNAYVRRLVIVNSVTVNFINTQSTAIPANAQLDIAFSAHNYTILESNSLNNTALYFRNGTVAYSWLEGGVTNNQEYAANVLSISANVYFWFKSPPSNTFLPANTGTTPMNTIYIGFDVPSNNIMDGNFIGEAPQLSTTYAEYDNGKNIFNYYLVNPASTSGFTVAGTAGLDTNAPTGSYFDTPNAFIANTQGNNNYLYSNNPAFSAGNVITYWANVPNGALGDLFFMSSSSGQGQFSRIDERSGFPTDTGILITSSWTSWSGGGNVQNPIAASWDKIDVVITSTTSATMYDTPTSNTPLGTLGSASTGAQTISNYGDYFGFQGDSAGSGSDYWDALIVRSYLPGGVFPEATPSPSNLYNAPTVTGPSPSSQSVAPGSTATISDAGLSGGVSPYTYQWYEAFGSVPTETSANAISANTLLGVGTTSGNAQSQNAIFVTNTLTTLGSYYFALYASDSYPTAVNTIAAVITVANPVQSSGGGGSKTPYSFMLSDNITQSSSSLGPVFTITSSGAAYFQNQLPVTIQSVNPAIEITFACNVSISGNAYAYKNDIYGIGFGVPCGTEYNDSSTNIRVTYARASNASTTTTETTTTITTTSTSATTALTSVAQTATTTIPTPPLQQKIITVPHNQSVVQICATNANESYAINYKSMGSTIDVSQNSSGCFSLNAINLTTSSEAPPQNNTKIIVINISVDSPNANLNATISYPCADDPAQVAPYIFKNGTWVEINQFEIDASSCTIHFPIPKDPIIGVFVDKTGTSPTTIPASVQSGKNPENSQPYMIIVLASAVIIVILIAVLSKRKKNNK